MHPHSTAVIIMNWKRPQNIGAIVRTTSAALPNANIFVIDHGEGSDSLARRDDVPRHLCWIAARANAGAGARFKLAAELPFEHYLCIDDDTFLTPDQIRALMDELCADPDRAHGVTGQLLTRLSATRFAITYNVRTSGEISILNQVYAFTRSRARAALELAAALGFRDWADVQRCDDIIVSSAGHLPSRVHDLGPLRECATTATAGIAVHRSEGFEQEREAILARLISRGSLHVAQAADPGGNGPGADDAPSRQKAYVRPATSRAPS